MILLTGGFEMELNLTLIESLQQYLSKNTLYLQHLSYVFKKPSNNSSEDTNMQLPINDCLWAALCRIEETAEYLNSLNVEKTKRGTYDLFSLISNAQSMIDCIELVFKLFGIKCYYPKNQHIFSQKESKNDDFKISDVNYFKYLRSICFIHPLQTDRYAGFQGDSPEWCSYVDPYNNLFPFNNVRPTPDFSARLFKHEELDKHIYIYLSEINEYVRYKYNTLTKLTNGIKKIVANRKKKLRETKIKEPSEFNDYDTYLIYLKGVFSERYGYNDYTVDKWRLIFKTSLSEQYQLVMLEYQKYLKSYIAAFIEPLQTLNHKKLIELESDWVIPKEISYEYHYQLEKLIKLNFCFEGEKFENILARYQLPLEDEKQLFIIDEKKV